MASKGKKITLLDAGGMLSKEALLGYVFNELQPAVREDVERLLAQNEMYRDMVEGLKHVPNRAEAESILNELNVDVAERSGSAANVPGMGEHVGDFFWNYRRVAAVVGAVLLVSAGLFTFAILKVSGPDELAKSEAPATGEAQKEVITPDKTNTDFKPSEPGRVATPPGEPLMDSSQLLTGLVAGTYEVQVQDGSAEINAATPGAASSTTQAATNGIGTVNMNATGGTAPYSYNWVNTAPDLPSSELANARTKNTEDAANKKLSAEESYQYAARTQVAQDTVANFDLAAAGKKRERAEDDVAGDKEDLKQEVSKEEQEKAKEPAILYDEKAVLSNSTGVDPKYMADIPRATAEQMPVFPGGQEALTRYLRENLKYPKNAKEKGVQGNVYVRFIIGTGGRVKEITVIHGVSKEINAEAIRLISSMPKWEPGKEKGEPVAVELYQTIEFKIE